MGANMMETIQTVNQFFIHLSSNDACLKGANTCSFGLVFHSKDIVSRSANRIRIQENRLVAG